MFEKIKNLNNILLVVDSRTIYFHSLIIGVITGGGAILSQFSIHALSHYLFETAAGFPLDRASSILADTSLEGDHPFYLLVVLIPAIGGLLAGLCIHYLAPETQGSGDVLISSYAKNNQSGKTFGFHKTLDIAGELSGAILIFIVLFFIGKSEEVIRNIFLCTAIPGLIAVILVVFFVKDVPYKKKEKQKFKLDPSDKKLIAPLGSYFIFTFFIFNESFFIIRSQDIGFIWEYFNGMTALWFSFFGALSVALGNIVHTKIE